jgi:hypothetical protein
LTVLAAGVILAAVVNATFSLLAAIDGAALMFAIISTCGRQPPKASWTVPRRAMT